MLAALRQILERTFEHLAGLATSHVPGILAALILLALAVFVATGVRRLLCRLVHAAALERFLVESGLCDFLSRSGKIHAANLVADTAYWLLIAGGALVAIGAIDTRLTTQLAENGVRLLPRMAAAGAIVLAGAWLGRFFGRGLLVWACNEGLPYPRRLAAFVRVLVTFAAVVIAADHLEFARTVFIAAFLIVFGGLMLAGSIAAGIGARDLLKRRVTKPAVDESDCESLWHHV